MISAMTGRQLLLGFSVLLSVLAVTHIKASNCPDVQRDGGMTHLAIAEIYHLFTLQAQPQGDDEV